MKNILLLLIPIITLAQDVPVGYWKDYLAYNEPNKITIANEKIYCVAKEGLFFYNTEDNSINRFSKVDGLSDMNIDNVKYNIENSTLLITYSNCNIDIVKNGVITNISDVKRKNIIGEKKINSISFNKNLAYLSCSFGVVVIDLIRKEIKDTYKIGDNAEYVKINQTIVSDSLIYVATSKGIYSAYTDNLFLSDYNQWFQEDLFENISLKDEPFSTISRFKNTVIAIVDLNKDSVLVKNTEWEKMTELALNRPSISQLGESLIITDSNQIYLITPELEITTIDNLVDAYNSASIIDNEIWVADKNQGLLHYINKELEKIILVNSPKSNDIYSLEYFSEKLFVCHGGHMNFSVNQLNKDGASVMENGYEWINKDYYDLNIARDIVAVAFYNNQEFYASWYHGISVMEDNKHIIKYGYQNTEGQLDTTFYSNNRIQISDIKFDKNNNLWGLNSQVEKPLFVKTSNEEWHSFGMNQDINGLYFDEIIIDQANRKWGIIHEGGIFVYDDKNTISNNLDDEYKLLNTNTGNGNLPSMKVYTITEDLDGEIWVGTDQGIAVFYYPELMFSGFDFDAQQILIQEGDYGQYLLDSERINCIKIDGANRKWIGTESSGLYLLSEDGTEQIHHFTKYNSPLFSDKVLDVAINQISGEVFIATDQGLISYRSDATKGEETQAATYIFPNPVRGEFEGNIAISQLVENALVKITDINGFLVYQTIANGGQANWNGRNFKNEKVGSGVYLVFSSDSNGLEKIVSKILFIK